MSDGEDRFEVKADTGMRHDVDPAQLDQMHAAALDLLRGALNDEGRSFLLCAGDGYGSYVMITGGTTDQLEMLALFEATKRGVDEMLGDARGD